MSHPPGIRIEHRRLGKMRIPTKKIIHSELKKIILSLSDAGKNIVEQLIIIGQGKCSTIPEIPSTSSRFFLLYPPARANFA